MHKILISINPVHIEKILNGTKRYEFRKVRCRFEVDTMFIYSTAPVGMVVCEAEIVSIIEETPEIVWERTSGYSGIDKAFFDRYYKDRPKAVAYELGKITSYPVPRKLLDFGIRFAPQSFVYIP